jgi:predicted O-methyltransferase YrrM
MLVALPTIELVDITGAMEVSLSIEASPHRHAWSLGPAEQFALRAILAGRRVRTAFEIGTFNGGTTRLLAESLPEDGHVITLDLPASAFDATQSPNGIIGTDVGRAYRDSPAASRVTQLLEDSLAFDPAPYGDRYDLVLVDGGHEFVHGVADTRTALRLVAPGGLILWDDFAPCWDGLVRGVCQEMAGRPLCRLAGTALGAYLAPPEDATGARPFSAP